MLVEKTPNFDHDEEDIEILSIEDYLQEVYEYNHSELARMGKLNVWRRLSRYTIHDHNGMMPNEVWKYIRETTKDNIDRRNTLCIKFLKGFVKFCREDHKDIPVTLTGNSHKEGGKYSKPVGTYTLSPEKRKRKLYLCKLGDTTLPAMVGGTKTLMSRVGGLEVPDKPSSLRFLGVPKVIKKGTYDVEEDEGKPLTSDQARYVIEGLSNKKVIAMCYFMNYSGFRSGEVYDVKKSELQWLVKQQLLRVRIPQKVIKDTITKGWRYGTLSVWEKVRPLLEGLSDDAHPFRSHENQKRATFENNVRQTLRVIYDSNPELNERDPENNRYFYNVHSWRARCSTEYARTQGVGNADGYLRHARGLTTYYKKGKEEREKQFCDACPDLAIYQVDKKDAELVISKKENSRIESLEEELRTIKEDLERQKDMIEESKREKGKKEKSKRQKGKKKN